MAAKKKAKSRKAAARKSAPRRKSAKVARKPVRKAPARRAAARTPKRVARPAVRAKPPVAARAPQAAAPPGERIGVVTHYYGHLSVAVVKLEGATLRVGDAIHFRGHTTDFGQRVESLQVEHNSVPEVGPQDDFGLKVRDHVREHDVVYRVRP